MGISLKIAEVLYSFAGLRHKPCAAQTHGFLMIYCKGKAMTQPTLLLSPVKSAISPQGAPLEVMLRG